MSTRYILVTHSRPLAEIEAYLYAHTAVIGYLKFDATTQATLLETMTQPSLVDYHVNYQADRLRSDGRFGVLVFEAFGGATAAMLKAAEMYRGIAEGEA
jgi:hypothetical protein